MYADIQTNWRKASLGRRDAMPALDVLLGGALRPDANTVFLPLECCGDKLIMIRDWSVEHIHRPYTLFSRFAFRILKFETMKSLAGFTFEFTDASDYVYFKLRWYSGGHNG
jgi:hypothetical protein